MTGTELAAPAGHPLPDELAQYGTTVVLEKCDDGTAPGRWVCLTHRQILEHNLARSSHVDDDGEHVLAWYCSAHGIETP